MRSTSLLAVGLCLLATACGASATDENVFTEQGNEVNGLMVTLERELSPPLAAPKSEHIGASTNDIIQQAKDGLTFASTKTDETSSCKTSIYDDASKRPKLTIVDCPSAIYIRLTKGKGIIEHDDLNKDGKIDRYTSDDGLVAQYSDLNFDGEVDLLVERISELEDFNPKVFDLGEDEYPASFYVFRIRQDANGDGKLDFERVMTRGMLANAPDEAEAAPSAELEEG